MPYSENKKIGGLEQVSLPMGDSDNVVVEQSGTAKKASLLQLIAKIFNISTTISPTVSSDSAVVVRQDGSVGKASLTSLLADNSVTNNMLVGNIQDTKLNTISTPGKILDSATSATDGRTSAQNATYNSAANDDIVKRNSNGDFSANVITASLSGNATSASNIAGKTANSILYQSNSGTTGEIVSTSGTTGKYLRSNGAAAAPTWEDFASVSSTADDLVGGAAGTLVYQESETNTKFLAPGATNTVLMSPGPFSPPVWYPTSAIQVISDTIVRRDSLGNFAGGTVTATTGFSGNLTGNVTGNVSGSSGSCTGNSATATRWQNGRTISLTGGASGTSESFDGSGNISIPVTVNGSQHTHSDLTNATPNNVANTLVKRSASGDIAVATLFANAGSFSGTVTAANFSGNASSATTVSGVATVMGTSSSGQNTSLANKSGPEITGSGGGGATFSLHRPGAYGLNVGLDSDNIFRIGGWSASSNRLQLNMSGDLTVAGNVTAYSDMRLKKHVETLGNALDTVKALRGVSFEKDGKRGIGVIAQEIRSVLPEAVQEDNTGFLSVAYGNIVGLLIEAIKELEAEVQSIKPR